MAGLIPQQFIDELLARTDIVDIIDAYVPLKKAGKNHQACCPFHDEKTPSFTVSQQKQFYHCFGCGANGSAIGFLMEYLNVGFVEAVEELASRAGLEVPREAGQSSKASHDFAELYELMELVNKFYQQQLRKHSQAERVVSYLKGRSISGEIAARYELGFAPPGWDNLISALGTSENAQQRLLKTGAIIENDRGGYYDRFRDRLMFPIRDQRGRAIGFGGRVLDDSKPKYLNSPETPIFQKGLELYGLYQARKGLKEHDCLFIVEGYMDVIALAQHGIGNAVASLGTAATPEHIDKLFRLTSKLVFCFDGDEAGNKAAWRALENVLPLLKDGRQVYFIFLPQGEDPDSYVRQHGKSAFLESGLQTPLSEFLFATLQAGHDLDTPEGRAMVIEKARPLLGKVAAGAMKKILIDELARLTRYDVEALESELPASTHKSRPVRKPEASAKGIEKIRWLVRALLHQPELANTVDSVEALSEFHTPGIDFLCELIRFIQQHPQITTASILENWRDTKFERRLRELASEEATVNEIGVNDEEFRDSISRLIEANRHEFELFKMKSKPSELSEEQKQRYREMQKSESSSNPE